LTSESRAGGLRTSRQTPNPNPVNRTDPRLRILLSKCVWAAKSQPVFRSSLEFFVNRPAARTFGQALCFGFRTAISPPRFPPPSPRREPRESVCATARKILGRRARRRGQMVIIINTAKPPVPGSARVPSTARRSPRSTPPPPDFGIAIDPSSPQIQNSFIVSFF